MRLPSIQPFEIERAPWDFIKRSSQLPRNVDLSNLRRLRIDAGNFSDPGIAKLKSLVPWVPNLFNQSLPTDSRGLPVAFSSIPRLFVILPDTSTSWDPKTMFYTRLRLHFICDCGEHTKANGSKIPHDRHLANREGYVLRKPKEFFEKYEFLVRISVKAMAHIVVCNLSIIPDLIMSAIFEDVDYSSLEEDHTLIKKSEGVDANGNGRALQHDLASYLASIDGLEGESLHKFVSYLAENCSDNLLGNLHRIMTKDGQVRWVCSDHYGSGYQEVHTQKLRELVKLAEGEFDEQLGRVEIRLGSSFAASEFYEAVSKAKGILDLDVGLGWNQDYADFFKLKDMISKSNIRSLRVNLTGKQPPRSTSVSIEADDFSDRNIVKLKLLVALAPNLLSLKLETSLSQLPAVFSSIAEYQTYPISFMYLRLLPPRSESRPSKIALQDLTHLFEVHGAQVETLDVFKIELDDLAVGALATATQNGSSLRELNWPCGGRSLSDTRIKDLTNIIAQSELHSLRIELEKDDASVHILESIQWTHIRRLEIHEGCQNLGIAMKVLVDSMEKVPQRIELEHFAYRLQDVSATQLELLRQVVSLLSLKHLDLRVRMTNVKALALLGSVDFSHMQYFGLGAKRWSSSVAQMILDALQNATQLQTIVLDGADITKEQKEQMYTKGIELKSNY
ncbi:hypothetical protein EDD21DRAFT_422253 [Dissophora ornata]|nr:hypothetical protein EDD21DRAFT_422253 [Dissophora ornata]